MTTSFYRETVAEAKAGSPTRCTLRSPTSYNSEILSATGSTLSNHPNRKDISMAWQLRRTIWILAISVLCLLADRAPAQDMAALQGKDAPAGALWVDSLDLSPIEQGFGQPQAGRSVDNQPIKIKGVSFVHGVGTHAASEMRIDLKGAATKFISQVGVDDETRGKGSVVFEVYVDGKKIASSGLMRGGEAPKTLSADLTGAKQLVLIVTDGGDTIDWDHADWAGAVLFVAPGATEKPQTFTIPDAPAPAIVHPESPLPAIHGPRITGSTPGRPFLFLIPATGDQPISYSAANLPEGLTLDPKSGIISGSLKEPGTTSVELTVENAQGKSSRKLTIVGGEHKLALTPPMGWNSWNCWAGAVSDDKVRAAADAMVASGLAAHGFQYVNIDDCWEGARDSRGEIQTNRRFPDMQALAAYVHSKGLKLGIYSSPGPKTCAGYEASWKHEQQDADSYAKWGVDYLKYDWCSYGEIARNPDLAAFQKPYRVMRGALDHCSRDILYSLCQYGMGDVWKWGAEVGGNCWRTTGDITDSWNSMSGIGFGQAGHERYAGPGHWNDPDMLVVGKVGWGPSLHRTRLKPNEQITHISLWSLLAAPLLIGCDMTQMDAFTRALLTNDDVLAVSQDPLGKQARRIAKDGSREVWARPLVDGTIAVGLFNRGTEPATVKVTWSQLKLAGPQPVRDLWQQRDAGQFDAAYEATVPPHGTVLVKVGRE
ncbi:MAG: NPCBM/NEW2 domain-containing protein [Thermoguttaceae bacterium]